MTTLAEWKTDTSIKVLAQLPSQSYESALSLTEAYLSDVGGWIAESSSDPTGPGQPANGYAPQQAADQITATEFSKVYDFEIAVPLNVRFGFVKKLTDGLTSDQAVAAVQTLVSNWLMDHIDQLGLPIKSVSTGTVFGVVRSNGIQSNANRVQIQAAIQAGGKLLDIRTIALSYARRRFNLDSTWNVSEMYAEDGQVISIVILKYTDSSYQNLDPNAPERYLIGMSADTHSVVGGSTITP